MTRISIAQHISLETEGALSPAQASGSGRLFSDLTETELRAMAVATGCRRASWDQWTRDMLLAFHHNRHGKYVPQS